MDASRDEWARLTLRLLKELQPTLNGSTYAGVRNFVEYVEPADFDKVKDELAAQARKTGGGRDGGADDTLPLFEPVWRER